LPCYSLRRKKARAGLVRAHPCFSCHRCYRGPHDPRPDHRQHFQHNQQKPQQYWWRLIFNTSHLKNSQCHCDRRSAVLSGKSVLLDEVVAGKCFPCREDPCDLQGQSRLVKKSIFEISSSTLDCCWTLSNGQGPFSSDFVKPNPNAC
jgi:hypothetical protein